MIHNRMFRGREWIPHMWSMDHPGEGVPPPESERGWTWTPLHTDRWNDKHEDWDCVHMRVENDYEDVWRGLVRVPDPSDFGHGYAIAHSQNFGTPDAVIQHLEQWWTDNVVRGSGLVDLLGSWTTNIHKTRSEVYGWAEVGS